MSFVNLHNHSYYSLLDGLPKPESYILKAKEHGSPAVALTDHGVLYGAVEFYIAGKKHDVHAIIGCEVYLTPGSRHSKNPVTDTKRYHLLLLAKNNIGYHNLIQLVTKAHLEGMYYKPRIDWELLQQYHEGLIATSTCLGAEIPQAILAGKPQEEVLEIIRKYQRVFGSENFFLEIQPHTFQEQIDVNTAIIEIGTRYNIPLILTNDAHYVNKEDNVAQDTMLCIQLNKRIDETDRMTMMQDDYSLLSPIEVLEKYQHLPQVLSNTLEIERMCKIDIPLGKSLMPSFPAPNNQTPEEMLRELCYKGFVERYNFNVSDTDFYALMASPKYDIGEKTLADIVTDEGFFTFLRTGFSDQKNKVIEKFNEEQSALLNRLEYELFVIHQMNFDTYFLIVQDFVNWAKQQGIFVGPGRGSVGGSMVGYVSKITNIDPLQYGLLFERFLNPSRISMPDIDLDFADTRRDEVLSYVRHKYGEDHVAQISTFGTMAARQAVKDAGRALGFSFAEMTELAKLIPEKPGTKLSDVLSEQSEIKKVREKGENYKKLFDIALKIEGSIRHMSVHACAVVISDEPLTQYTALQYPPRSDSNACITQLSAKPIEALGLLKMDFLGLRNLSVIETTLKIIERTKQKKVDIERIPLDDKKAYQVFCDGATTGVFQFESAGMKRYLKQLKPSCFEDIIAMGALYRPGPMDWIPDYIAYKHGKKIVRYPHKDLESVLKETYGIAIYQEQILQIVQKFAGFSLGDADLLRRAIGKKIKTELMAQKDKFIQMSKNKGHSEEEAIFIFEKVIEPFAQYGFNKSHAACYAMISYQTAYLKAHYPTEFMAALLSSEAENIERIAINIEECQRMGISVLPPSVNESREGFTYTKEGEIRFGLKGVKGLGSSMIDAVLKNRMEEGSFSQLTDFARRIPHECFNRKSLESLIYSGAFDIFGGRRSLISILDKMIDYAKNVQEKEKRGQVSLFDLEDGTNSFDDSLALPDISDNPVERLFWEKQFLGLYISGHPLDGLKKYIKKKSILVEDMQGRDAGKTMNVIGIIVHLKKIFTKNKEPMMSLTIQDPSGSMECVIFPKVYGNLNIMLQEDMLVSLTGKVERRNEQFQMMCHEVRSLDLGNMILKAKEEGFFDPKQKVVMMQSYVADREDVEDEEMSNVIPTHISEEKGAPSYEVSQPIPLEETTSSLEEVNGDITDISFQHDEIQVLDKEFTEKESIPAEDNQQTEELFSPTEIVEDYVIEVPANCDREMMVKLQQLLQNHSQGAVPVILNIQGKKIKTPFMIDKDSSLSEKMEGIFHS